MGSSIGPNSFKLNKPIKQVNLQVVASSHCRSRKESQSKVLIVTVTAVLAIVVLKS